MKKLLFAVVFVCSVSSSAFGGERLTEAFNNKLVAAGLPVVGVSIADAQDRMTWRVDWASKPTAQQIAQAKAIIDNFDAAAEEAKVEEAHGTSRAEIIARGIGRVLESKGIATRAEIRAAIKAEWEASK